QGHPVGSDLAEADTVPPPLAAEDEGLDVSVRGYRAVDGEQVLAHPEGGPDLEATDVELAPAPGDAHLHHAPADAPPRRLDVLEAPHIHPGLDQRREVGPRVALLPAVGGRVAVVRDGALVGDDL